MRNFGLIGFPLGHSFSKKYFSEKFDREKINNCKFDLYEIAEIDWVQKIMKDVPSLEGLSVTIPYKEKVIPFLDELDPACKEIGAVNCIRIRNGKTKGYNTDYIGFKKSLESWLKGEKPNALILGTGGASKAVKKALEDLDISFDFVSRTKENTGVRFTYEDLKNQSSILKDYLLIINTTPLGTFPEIEKMPNIPLDQISGMHKVYDLVYNPENTFLMRTMEARGASTKNGYEMLQLQAEAAWEIWNT
jgi:shikimate dehydrogenase